MNNSIFTIGLILIVLGVVMAVFSFFGDFDLFPNDARGRWMTGLIVLGFIVMIVAAAMPSISSTTESVSTPATHRRTRTVIREE